MKLIQLDIVKHEADHLKRFAAWLYIKSIFRSSRYNRSSINYLAKTSLVSRKTINKYINHWLKTGQCTIQGKGLIFSSINKYRKSLNLNKTHLAEIKIENISQLTNELRSIIFINKIKQFEYKKRLNSDLINPDNVMDYRNAKRRAKKCTALPMPEEIFKISLKKIAEDIGASVYTAQQMIYRLRKAGIIERILNHKSLGKFSKKANISAIESGIASFVSKRGFLIKQDASSYKLINL